MTSDVVFASSSLNPHRKTVTIFLEKMIINGMLRERLVIRGLDLEIVIHKLSLVSGPGNSMWDSMSPDCVKSRQKKKVLG